MCNFNIDNLGLKFAVDCRMGMAVLRLVST
jgi:hypothetical protein